MPEMSTETMADFSRLVLDHPAKEQVRTRVQLRLFERFRKASPEERDVINAIMDNEQLFWREIEAVVAEHGRDPNE